MTREILEALKELEAKATAGPWEVGNEIKCDCGECSDTCWHTFDNQTAIYPPLGELGPIAEVSDHDSATLISAARNNLLQLLRIAEAAMELMQNEDVKRDMQDTAIFDKLAVAIGGDECSINYPC